VNFVIPGSCPSLGPSASASLNFDFHQCFTLRPYPVATPSRLCQADQAFPPPTALGPPLTPANAGRSGTGPSREAFEKARKPTIQTHTIRKPQEHSPLTLDLKVR
jgi:hypothetical protein